HDEVERDRTWSSHRETADRRARWPDRHRLSAAGRHDRQRAAPSGGDDVGGTRGVPALPGRTSQVVVGTGRFPRSVAVPAVGEELRPLGAARLVVIDAGAEDWLQTAFTIH